jgi:hypothetical protein
MSPTAITAATSSVAVLGTHPVLLSAMRSLLVLGGGASVIFLTAQIPGINFFTFVILGPLFGFIIVPINLSAPVIAFFNSGKFNKARRAIASGEIHPDWVIRDAMGRGIAMVDEGAGKIFINDRVHEFDEVKSITWARKNMVSKVIEFTLKEGANPVKRVFVGYWTNLDQVSARLMNSLDFT